MEYDLELVSIVTDFPNESRRRDNNRLDKGELVALEVRSRGLAGLFGKFRDDPTLREICEEAYKERDTSI